MCNAGRNFNSKMNPHDVCYEIGKDSVYKPSTGSETDAGLDVEPSSCTISSMSARNFIFIQGVSKGKRQKALAKAFKERPPGCFKPTNLLLDH